MLSPNAANVVAVTNESGLVGLVHPSVSPASPIVVANDASRVSSLSPTRLFSVLLAALRLVAALRPVMRPAAAPATTSTLGPWP